MRGGRTSCQITLRSSGVTFVYMHCSGLVSFIMAGAFRSVAFTHHVAPPSVRPCSRPAASSFRSVQLTGPPSCECPAGSGRSSDDGVNDAESVLNDLGRMDASSCRAQLALVAQERAAADAGALGAERPNASWWIARACSLSPEQRTGWVVSQALWEYGNEDYAASLNGSRAPGSRRLA